MEHCTGWRAEHSKFSAENYVRSRKHIPRKSFDFCKFLYLLKNRNKVFVGTDFLKLKKS